ncbi:MAG: nitrite reductase large subunit NirB [Pseudomonadota bacterium]
MKKPNLVVVGNGMVGHTFLERLLDAGGADTYTIDVFGEESRPAYDRVHLSEYVDGRSEAELRMPGADRYAERGIAFHPGEAISALDTESKSLTLADGRSVPYDTLVLATGSRPFVPPIPGNDLDGCFVYRTLDDLDAIKAGAANGSVGVVIGGGLLGLEATNALQKLGLEAHVIEFAPRLMPVQLDDDGGRVLRERIEALGITVHTDCATSSIVSRPEGGLRLTFADGDALDADVVVFSAGIRARDELARAAGLAVGERGGVVIDDHCRTSAPDVLAIGECASWQGRQFGLVAPGYRMAEAAVATLTGGDAVFAGADMSTKLKLLGVEVGSVGDAHAGAPGATSICLQDQAKASYAKLVLQDNAVTGAVLVGDTSAYDTVLQYALNGLPLPDNPVSLIVGDTGGAALSADSLPDTATICSCLNVSKGAIIQAVDDGHHDLAAVKQCTGASSGCGGCAALTTDVIQAALTARGIAVDRSLCRHFRYTRQELFHLVQVNRHQTFDAVLEAHGSGQGCEICKPAVASILASVWNDYILTDAHLPLQDTNDRFLANMQKNGSFSVVPRVAGGEITPDKLIVIGEVARDFDLYTKITGGQRIDLFGAQKADLPAIWARLIDAGFETGHAYGKSLRTVKSCVGSTWCRYGVQDSVGMAIRLENRYKGLRAPHKVKMAVSGCTRECAEAQSKDVGVIATENGWNLFVCGNGGMRPRHADLFATDLSDAELIRYIDRVLMFYVRTGDRLQRTSVWLEKLDGGLDYLRDVVIEDSLGIGDELEAQMAHIVESYQCEWTTTLASPERLKHFNTFVNTDKRDGNVEFTRERGQIKPLIRMELESHAN